MLRLLLAALLFLVALSASADCTSRTLFTGKSVQVAHIDRGVLYLSFAHESVIWSVDEATGAASPVFTAEANLDQWDVENNVIAVFVSPRLILVPRDGAPRVVVESADIRSFQLHHGYLYW